MSHLLSEPDNPNACHLTGVAAQGYRPRPTAGWTGSTTSLKFPTGSGSISGPIVSPEPSAIYAPDNFNHPDMPNYTPPSSDTVGRTVEPPANYWEKVAEANAPPEDMSIATATSKAKS